MAYFNYRNLDPTDFEALAKDVMERVLGCKLYRYGDGSDGGIDLSDDSKKHKIVVQCKRYHQGAFSNLLGVLKREEKPKLERMDPRPEKYYLFTSIDLLPEQKVKILNLFNEFMKDDESFIVDGIAINEFFKDKKNHDLIERNRKLFDSYPENYDGLTDVNDEATREINIKKLSMPEYLPQLYVVDIYMLSMAIQVKLVEIFLMKETIVFTRKIYLFR